MAEFGTLDFAVSFSPTTAFPLDSRYYFESLEEANNAASKAVPAGSSDGKYFFGENVVVVADGKATMYIIQPDKTLSEVGEGSSAQQDYAVLSNKPSIGGVELNGDMTLDDLGIKQEYTASDISFSDGQTFQQKYDSGDLNGDDGFSPTVQVTTTEDSHTVVITDKAGPHEFLIKNGTNGLDGEDGFSPIVSIEEIPGGHRVGVQDSSGTETFDVMNGQDGAAGDSGVFYGETEPEDPNVMVWINPAGESLPASPRVIADITVSGVDVKSISEDIQSINDLYSISIVITPTGDFTPNNLFIGFSTPKGECLVAHINALTISSGKSFVINADRFTDFITSIAFLNESYMWTNKTSYCSYQGKTWNDSTAFYMRESSSGGFPDGTRIKVVGK